MCPVRHCQGQDQQDPSLPQLPRLNLSIPYKNARRILPRTIHYHWDAFQQIHEKHREKDFFGQNQGLEKKLFLRHKKQSQKRCLGPAPEIDTRKRVPENRASKTGPEKRVPKTRIENSHQNMR
jgi:hypothetical protein